jgi:hypothetical protein
VTKTGINSSEISAPILTLRYLISLIFKYVAAWRYGYYL